MRITTELTLCDAPTAASLEQTVLKTMTPETKSLLILACEADKWEPEHVDVLLTGLNIPVLGGVFPFIIFEGEKLASGTLIVGLNVSIDIFFIENLSQGKAHIQTQLEQLNTQVLTEEYLLAIVDGFTSNIERFTEGLYEITGHNSIAFGGGAGTLDFIQKPCLFTNRGMLYDAAILATLPIPFTLGVSHGWEIEAGPFLVTQSKGNVLNKLDYSPAFDVYQEHVSNAKKQYIDQDDFYDLAKGYPLGIENLEGEILVRGPLSEDNKSLSFIGEIPENSIVYLLKGSNESLINASGYSAKMAFETSKLSPQDDMSAILFDCVSRPLFLGDDFSKELDVIKENLNNHPNVFGAISIGEIGSNKNGPIDWLNKSTAIAVF